MCHGKPCRCMLSQPRCLSLFFDYCFSCHYQPSTPFLLLPCSFRTVLSFVGIPMLLCSLCLFMPHSSGFSDKRTVASFFSFLSSFWYSLCSQTNLRWRTILLPSLKVLELQAPDTMPGFPKLVAVQTSPRAVSHLGEEWWCIAAILAFGI